MIPPTVKASGNDPELPIDVQDEQEAANEAIRDLLLARLQKLVGKSEFTRASIHMHEMFGNYLLLLQADAQHADELYLRQMEENCSTESPKVLEEVLEATNKVLEQIDQTALAVHLGTRNDTRKETTAQKQANKLKTRDVEVLIDIHSRRVRALATALINRTSECMYETKALLATAYAQLEKWTDTNAPANGMVLEAASMHDRAMQMYGRALERILKVRKTQSDKVFVSDKKVRFDGFWKCISHCVLRIARRTNGKAFGATAMETLGRVSSTVELEEISPNIPKILNFQGKRRLVCFF